MTSSAERAGVASMAVRGRAANGGTALASHRSGAVTLSAVPTHPSSSRPALCCVIAAAPHSGSEVLCRVLREAGVRPLVRSHPAGLPEARFSPLQYIFLWRRDTARQAIAYYRAVHELPESPDSGDPGDPGPVDLQQIRWFEDLIIEQRENWREFFTGARIRPIEVQYESLVDAYPLNRDADERAEAILAAYLPLRDFLAPKSDEVGWNQSAKRFVIAGQAARFAVLG